MGDDNFDTIDEKTGNMALHLAVLNKDYKTASLLLTKCDPNINTNYGTPLGIAVYNGDVEMVRLLLDKGADVNFHQYDLNLHNSDQISKNQTSSPLAQAIEQNHFEMVKLLIERGSCMKEVTVNFLVMEYDSALHIALRYDRLEIIKLILSKMEEKNIFNPNDLGLERESLLHVAVQYSSLGAVKLLYSKGADLDVKDCYNQGLFELALYSDHDIQIIEWLLSYGNNDVNNIFDDGTRPLHLAVRNQNFDLIKLLLDKGANPNLLNGDNKSPYHLALRKAINSSDFLNSLEIIKTLKECGAIIQNVEQFTDELLNIRIEREDNTQRIISFFSGNDDPSAPDFIGFREAGPVESFLLLTDFNGEETLFNQCLNQQDQGDSVVPNLMFTF